MDNLCQKLSNNKKEMLMKCLKKVHILKVIHAFIKKPYLIEIDEMKRKWEEELRSQLQANHEMIEEVNTSWKDKVFLIPHLFSNFICLILLLIA